MNEAELIEQARQQGATHYSRRFGEFHRRNDDGQMETAKVREDGTLGPWQSDWLSYPPESAVRL